MVIHILWGWRKERDLLVEEREVNPYTAPNTTQQRNYP